MDYFIRSKQCRNTSYKIHPLKIKNKRYNVQFGYVYINSTFKPDTALNLNFD